MSTEQHSFSDRIHIEELEVSTHVGVLEEERGAPQRLTAQYYLLAISRTCRLGSQN
jgi:hypothetical protein